MEALATLLLCLQPVEAARVERVDRIETNHVYGEIDGCYLFTQLIFFDHNGDIVTYRMVKEPQHWPTKRNDGTWELLFWDDGVLRRIETRSWSQTWTQSDEEREQREVLPVEARRGLRK